MSARGPCCPSETRVSLEPTRMRTAPALGCPLASERVGLHAGSVLQNFSSTVLRKGTRLLKNLSLRVSGDSLDGTDGEVGSPRGLWQCVGEENRGVPQLIVSPLAPGSGAWTPPLPLSPCPYVPRTPGCTFMLDPRSLPTLSPGHPYLSMPAACQTLE